MSVYPVVFGKLWDINSFKHTTLSLIYESNFFRVLRICVAECIFDFVKRDTVFSQHCNLFTQKQCHMFCETRKSFLTAYLRFHLGDIHREDIWQYHNTGNINGHSAIISKIPSYTRIFRNPKLYNNLRKHYWRTELWWSLSSFFIGGILLKQIFICFNENFYIDSLSEKKQCTCIKGGQINMLTDEVLQIWIFHDILHKFSVWKLELGAYGQVP